MLEMQQKEVVSADIRAYYEERKNLVIEVELPGVERDDIKLRMNNYGFHVRAEGPDFICEACVFFPDDTTLDRVWAEFDRGSSHYYSAFLQTGRAQGNHRSLKLPLPGPKLTGR